MSGTVQSTGKKIPVTRYLHVEKLEQEIKDILKIELDPSKRRDGHALLLRRHLAVVLDSVWNNPKWPVATWGTMNWTDWRGIVALFFCPVSHGDARKAILKRFRQRCEVYRDDGEHAYYRECEAILGAFTRADQWVRVQNRALVPYVFEDFK